MMHHFSADFSRKTLNALTKKGLAIISATWIPAPGGDYLNGEMAYQIAGCLYRRSEVIALAV